MGDTRTTTRTASNPRSDLWVVGVVWVLLTVAAEIWAFSVQVHPPAASEQAEVIDQAFDLLLYLGIPVITFVITMLGWSLIRFRARGQETDGPPLRTHRGFVGAWVVVSSALAVLVIFNPGLKGLSELDELATDPEMTIQVKAEQWNWSYTYVDHGITIEDADSLTIPVDTRIRFEITSEDVIHSFWIPAFRIKMDAVPGKATTIALTATATGTFASDDGFRVQCAELCGTGHARMWTRVEVLEDDDFEAWLGSL